MFDIQLEAVHSSLVQRRNKLQLNRNWMRFRIEMTGANELIAKVFNMLYKQAAEDSVFIS